MPKIIYSIGYKKNTVNNLKRGNHEHQKNKTGRTGLCYETI